MFFGDSDRRERAKKMENRLIKVAIRSKLIAEGIFKYLIFFDETGRSVNSTTKQN